MQDPHSLALAELLRQNGFFESLPPAATPLAAHLFQEYASLRASLSALRAELLELRETATFQQKLLQPIQADNRKLLEENNFLTLRIAELEDQENYQNNPLPPLPSRQNFGGTDAESHAMEAEIRKLRAYCKEVNLKSDGVEEECKKLKNELEWGYKNNEKVVQQLEAEKRKKSSNSYNNSNNSQNLQNVQIQEIVSNTLNISNSVSRSSLESVQSVHTHEIQIQTEEEACFNCSIYIQQINDLKSNLRNKNNISTANNTSILNNTQQQLFTSNQQLSSFQLKIDELNKKILGMEIEVQNEKQLNLEKNNSTAELQATNIVQTALISQLEKQILNLQTEKLDQVQEKQNHIQLYNNVMSEQKGVQLEHIKLQKTAQKLGQTIMDLKARRKLDEGVICRLDKANSVMSGFLSKLSLENQRLKRKFGVEELGVLENEQQAQCDDFAI
ncbi:hypothetical protein SS50377_28593 [Spironucleus salmonicida]|uniref:Uncharacterized protein n=1 Tax=Spironucleus salmonicida TaxID=348837 RepID=V6LLK9_9EUKA|nr:hypothetical protein SS50377_28593 [Spironucleus salmonicida]|eukprot:EST41584.1 hypothetical protein SS50377_18925 [Spironucleus salmonicida]